MQATKRESLVFAQGDFVTQILAAERLERYFVCPCLPY